MLMVLLEWVLLLTHPDSFIGWCTHVSTAVWIANGLQLTPHQFHHPTHRPTHTHTHTQKCPQTRKEWSFRTDWSIVNGWLGIIDPHLSSNWGHLCRTVHAPEPPVDQASTRPPCDYILAQFFPLPTPLASLPYSFILKTPPQSITYTWILVWGKEALLVGNLT